MISIHSQPNGNLTMRVDTPDGKSYNKLISTQESISDNTWHFISAKIDGNNTYLYIDGELKIQSSFLGDLGVNAGFLHVGKRGIII
jgi:hypothetical protein